MALPDTESAQDFVAEQITGGMDDDMNQDQRLSKTKLQNQSARVGMFKHAATEAAFFLASLTSCRAGCFKVD